MCCRNFTRCYPSDGNSQPKRTFSIGSNGNCGLRSRYRTSGCRISEISDFTRQLEANTNYGPCGRRNLTRCYLSDGNSQLKRTFSIESNGNCGLRSRYLTSGFQIFKISLYVIFVVYLFKIIMIAF